MSRIPAITPQGIIIGWWQCIKAPEPSRGDPHGLWVWQDAGAVKISPPHHQTPQA